MKDRAKAKAEVDTRPDWIKLLVDTLGFKPEKVKILAEKHYVSNEVEFFDAYAPDKENGLC